MKARADAVPGPGTYRPEHYRTCLSLKDTQPFAKQHAVAKHVNGQIRDSVAPEDTIREAFGSDIRNPPAVRFGKPPKKSRLDLKRLMQCADCVWGVN